MTDFGQGLALSGIGILVTFCALGILILLILVLRWLFPARKVDQAGFVSGFETDHREALKEQAAAAAVAALLEQDSGTRKSSLGSILEDPPGNWWRRGQGQARGKE